MTKNELRAKLHYEGVNPHYYSIDGKTILEGYCLAYQDGLWCVYYSERGIENNKRYFDVENDACLYFYNTVLKDPLLKMSR